MALVGVAGTGKSTLAAALMRPKLARVPSPPASLTLSHFSTVASRRPTWPACWSTSSTAPSLASPPSRKDYSLTEDEQRRLDALQRDVLGRSAASDP